MRVGIIRGDLPGPLFMADLEPTSQVNFPTEPSGQTRYIGRPDTTLVGDALALNAGAGLEGTATIVLSLVINGGNQTLKVKTSAAASFTTVLIPAATYTTLAELIDAANPLLAVAGVALEIDPLHSNRVVLYSLTLGAGSYIENDTVAHGSTFNTPVHLPNGASFTVATAAALITATLPVGGPIDVSAATMRTELGPALTDAQVSAVADSIAPQFVETDVAIKSFEVGNLSGYISASYNPDPNRQPALPDGAAISVVEDDGTTLFTAPLPSISGAVHNSPHAGDITITGVNMASEDDTQTVVHVSSGTTNAYVRLEQKLINYTLSGSTQGSVAPTSIVIPASLLNGLGIVGSRVQVQYTSFVTNVFVVT